MSTKNLSDDLIRFIHTSIPGIPFLETLLLLRTEPNRSWAVEAVCNRLYLSPATVRELLKSLCAAGMAVEERSEFRYAPQSDQLRLIIDQLAECYRYDLVGTTKIIHSRAGKSAQIFADAFKLKKDS
jgi:hypothetical protein